MQRILASNVPDDFVVASGRRSTVREFAEMAFAVVGLDYRQHVQEDCSVIRKTSPRTHLVGDSSKLRATTGWAPATTLEDLARDMVLADLAAATH